MKLTEKEQFNTNETYAYEVLDFAKSDREKFLEVSDYLPFAIHESEKSNLNHIYQNKKLLKSFEGFEKEIEVNSIAFFSKISDPQFFKIALEKISSYELANDDKSICTYFQRLPFQGKMSWVLTHKSFCEKNTFMTLAQPLRDLGSSGKLLRDILGDTCLSRNGWELFKTLTKREKQLMRLLCIGMTSRQISDRLYISKLTVDTHRKHLFKKLEINSFAQLFTLAQGFKLLDLK